MIVINMDHRNPASKMRRRLTQSKTEGINIDCTCKNLSRMNIVTFRHSVASKQFIDLKRFMEFHQKFEILYFSLT